MIKDLEDFKKHPAYLYAQGAVNGDFPTGHYIRKVCENFLEELENEDSEYYFDLNMVNGITAICGLIIVPSGVAAGKPVSEMLAGFQWFFLLNVLCWVMKDNHAKRRYEMSVMLIARKSGKTFLTAIIFIILLLLEPKNSHFYSVAPTLDLSRLIFVEVTAQLKNSPHLIKKFNVTKQYIECLINSNVFTPLANGKQTLDGRLANVFLVDEAGALKNSYPITSMKLSQRNILNKTGIVISTAYPTLDNPMTEYVQHIEKVIDGEREDDKLFGMLYKPDNPNEWKTNDDEILKANPLAVIDNDTFEILKKTRKDALEMEGTRGEFLTKNMNIFINGGVVDTYVTSEEMQNIEVPVGTIDWSDKEVYVGLDLSQSEDNTAIAMTSYDKDTGVLLAKTWIFYPSLKELDKKKSEGLDYSRASDLGLSIPSGGMSIDYNQIEEFVMHLEENYGVIIKGIGYDPWGAPAMAVRLGQTYDVADVSQGDGGVYVASKFLKEKIVDNDFHFDENFLLMSNFLNAKKQTSSTMSYHLNKKVSDGKIDAVAAIIDSVALWMNEIEEEAGGEPEVFLL